MLTTPGGEVSQLIVCQWEGLQLGHMVKGSRGHWPIPSKKTLTMFNSQISEMKTPFFTSNSRLYEQPRNIFCEFVKCFFKNNLCFFYFTLFCSYPEWDDEVSADHQSFSPPDVRECSQKDLAFAILKIEKILEGRDRGSESLKEQRRKRDNVWEE